jgi:hypothetical protein
MWIPPLEPIVVTIGGASDPFPITVNARQPELLSLAAVNIMGIQKVVACFRTASLMSYRARLPARQPAREAWG